jgi:predicted porin
MKAKLLLLSASVLAANAAIAEVDFYGKVNVTLQSVSEEASDVETQDNVELSSNASRLGLKGSSEINDALKAIAQGEYEVFVDDGEKSGKTLTQRNTYVGVQGDFGRVIAGIHDTPTKMIGKPVDIFSDLTFGDIKNVVEGENRQKNMIMYRSPSFSGVKIDAMFSPGEEAGTDATTSRNGVADAMSASVSYELDGLSLAASYDSELDNQDTLRLVGAYSQDAFGASLMLQQADVVDSNSDESEEGIIVTAHYKLDNWKFKALYGMATESADGTEDLDRNQLVLGADYQLSKATKVFGYFANVNEEQGSVDVSEDDTFGLGVAHKF